MSIRLGLTGTGYAARTHAIAARGVPGVEITAVVNHRPESAQKFAAEFGIERKYTHITDLLTEGGVEGVIVNTPNALHAPETIAALQAGIHVMVEKPMAMNAAEAETMVAASRASGALLMVAHCFRFEREIQWLREQVKAGSLGQIVRTKGYGVHVAWGPAGWFNQKALAGGGAMADMGIHALDTARYLLGDPLPTRVYARIGTRYSDADVDDTGLVLVDWENGATSYFESGWWQPHADGSCAATQIYGTEGFGTVYPTYVERMHVNPRSFDRIESGFPVPEKYDAPMPMYEAQLAHFVECIRTGQQPSIDGESGLVNMRIVDAAYESARTNNVVHLQRNT